VEKGRGGPRLARVLEKRHLATNICVIERALQPPETELMLSRSGSVTLSRFQRKIPAGRHDSAFRVVFGSDARAARALRLSRMTIWRMRHDRVPLPKWVADILADLVHTKVAEAHEAEDQLRNFLREPPKPARRLSGCCAGYERKPALGH
jgi:hypothetical protein